MKISFVIPSFNSVTWLPHAVTSCLDQTHDNVEIVIVDDCSTDYTRQYLKSIKDKKNIKIVYNPVNMGRSKSRNIGNGVATGDVICVLDADDMAQKKRAEWTAEKFKSGIEFVYGSALIISADSTVIRDIRAEPFDKKVALEKMENRIVHSTVAYTKEFSRKYPYREGDIAALGIDDWDQQIRAALDGVALNYIPQVVTAYRVLESGISNQRDPEAVIKAKKEILEGLKVTV